MSFEESWRASQVRGRGRGRGLGWLAPVRPDEESPTTLGIVECERRKGSDPEKVERRGALYGGGRIPSSI